MIFYSYDILKKEIFMIGTPKNPFEFLVKYGDDSMLVDVLIDSESSHKNVKTSITLGSDEDSIIDVLQSPEIKEMVGSNRTQIISSLIRIGFDSIIASLDFDSPSVLVTYKGEKKSIPMRTFLTVSFWATQRLKIAEPDENVYDYQSSFDLYLESYIRNEKLNSALKSAKENSKKANELYEESKGDK